MNIRFACAALAALLAAPVLGAEPSAVTAPAVRAEPSPATPLAAKGDVVVTSGDFNAYIAKLKPSDQFLYRTDVNRITSAVSSIFVTRTLAHEAESGGMDKEPEVARRLQLAREQILAQLYMERFEKNIKVPDYEPHAREIYKADPDRFRIPEKFDVQYILVTTQGRTDAEARERADAARAKLVAGKNFEDVAREYTNDPSFRSNQGVYQGALTLFHPDVAAVARTLPLDTPSPVLHTSDGSYHIIIVKDRIPASVTPFERVKKGLIEADEAKYKKEITDRKLASITNDKGVQLYTDDIAAMKTTFETAKVLEMHQEAALREAEAKEARRREEAAKAAGK